MSFQAKLRQQEDELERAALTLFSFVHTKGSDNPDGQSGQMMPLFHIIDEQWRSHVVGTSLGKGPDKDAVAGFIRQYCGEAKAILLMFASEVWMRVAPVDEVDPLAQGATDHPDRVEGLMLNFESAIGARTVMFPMIRDETGVRLGTRKEGTSVEGRFSSLIARLDA